ncbi:MAG: hypothetical protein WCF53_22085 [Pseudolabrys sp.]
MRQTTIKISGAHISTAVVERRRTKRWKPWVGRAGARESSAGVHE